MNGEEMELRERMQDWLKTTALWKKILCFLQIGLSIAILLFAFLGLNDIMPIVTTNIVDLILLTVLFVISGIRFFPDRKLYTYIYFGVAALMLVILAVGLIL